MFPGSDAEFTAGVFFLLESACNELARVSFQLRSRVSDVQLHGKNTAGARSMFSGFVYSRMLWSEFQLVFNQQIFARHSMRIYNVHM